jgi:hypothetical protein
MNASLRAIDADKRYCAGAIAWNDGQRGVVGVNGKPTLSSMGGNITDCRIATADGEVCQYIKPSNMDETIGVMDAKDILTVGKDGTNTSLQEVLDDLQAKCDYRGYTSVKANADANQKVVVRAQISWVPVKRGTTLTKIVPEHYSFQTSSSKDPRNLLLLGTPKGLFVHNDDTGGNKLFAHSVTDSGEVNNHWFEAEANKDCMVGHASTMHDDAAPASKKARSVEMGIRGMGLRTNCFVTVAIPNTQAATKVPAASTPSFNGSFTAPMYRSIGNTTLCASQVEDDELPTYRSVGGATTGTSYAARVSITEESMGTAQPTPLNILRPDGEPIVVTVLTYNTIEVPDDFVGDLSKFQIATTDVALGVADLDRQYALVKKNGGVVCKLSELPAMLGKLTDTQMAQIASKLMEDPPLKPDLMTPTSSALAAFA